MKRQKERKMCLCLCLCVLDDTAHVPVSVFCVCTDVEANKASDMDMLRWTGAEHEKGN